MKIISIIAPLDIKLSCQDVFYRLNIAAKPDYISFLDSSLLPNKYSRFSYIAWEADFAIRGFIGRNEVLNISDNSTVSTIISGENPLIFLKKIFKKYVFWDNMEKKIDSTDNNFITGIERIYFDGNELEPLKDSDEICRKLPDFTGGFIGYISYDLKNYIENLPQTVKDDIKNPLFYFTYYSKLP
ncbi:MAG: hypothetical protein FJW56_07280, partial [Actinobacteria bacterium]|nr:hypothetical protein [Actinomycetota bacterium]